MHSNIVNKLPRNDLIHELTNPQVMHEVRELFRVCAHYITTEHVFNLLADLLVHVVPLALPGVPLRIVKEVATQVVYMLHCEALEAAAAHLLLM